MLAIVAFTSLLAVTAGERDPFAAPSPRYLRCPSESPLLQLEPAEMTLAATVALDTASPRAIVMLPGGARYTVRVGDRIGPNHGEVRAIRHDAVVVREYFVFDEGPMRTMMRDVLLSR